MYLEIFFEEKFLCYPTYTGNNEKKKWIFSCCHCFHAKSVSTLASFPVTLQSYHWQNPWRWTARYTKFFLRRIQRFRVSNSAYIVVDKKESRGKNIYFVFISRALLSFAWRSHCFCTGHCIPLSYCVVAG